MMKSEELRRSEMFCLHYFICRSYGAPTILNAKLLLACHSSGAYLTGTEPAIANLQLEQITRGL